MNPRLSCIMPVRDAVRTVDRALASCREQSFRDVDIVVILNGCTDESSDIVGHHAVEDARIRVLESPGSGGVIEAQRVGVAAARAAVLARMDADDVAHPERFARQWESLDGDRSLGAVGCGVRLIEGRGEGMRRYVEWVNGLRTPEDVARERFVECPVIQPSLMIRREVLEAVGGYRETSWAEDHDLVLRLLASGVRIGKVPEVLLDWRDGPDRLTRSHARYAEDEVWRMKAHHLAREPLVRERGAVIAGAGPIGKRLGRLLEREGAGVQAFLEVNERRIGQRIGGIPVRASENLVGFCGNAVLLSAVGVTGGRDRVRRIAYDAGFLEGRDFWCCC